MQMRFTIFRMRVFHNSVSVFIPPWGAGDSRALLVGETSWSRCNRAARLTPVGQDRLILTRL